MEKSQMPCKKCIHSEVCRFMESLYKAQTQVSDFKCVKRIDIECKYHEDRLTHMSNTLKEMTETTLMECSGTNMDSFVKQINS